MKTTATMRGNAQLVSVRDDEGYNESYHIVLVEWEDGRNTTIVLDDSGRPLHPIPYACWQAIDEVKVLTS